MSLYEKLKNMSIEEMAEERVRKVSFEYWNKFGRELEKCYLTSDCRKYTDTNEGKTSAIKHEMELLRED